MLRYFFAFCLCWLPFCGVQAASYEFDMKQCKEIMKNNPASVQIFYNFGTLEYNHNKTADEIFEVVKKNRYDIKPDKGSHLSGLTEFSPHFSLESAVSAQKLSDGRLCVYPSNVEVKVWYEPVVYIEKALKEGSCRYQVTLRHEQTHLEIGHYVLKMFVRALKNQVPLILENGGPKVVRDVDGIVNKMGENYQKQLNDIFNVFVKALGQKNMILDTPENYAKEDKICL